MRFDGKLTTKLTTKTPRIYVDLRRFLIAIKALEPL